MRKLQQAKNLIEAKDVFIRSCEAKNLSPRTIEFYESALTEFTNHAGNIPIDRIDEDTVNRFLVYGKKRGLAPGSVAGWARSVKRFINFHSLKVKVEKVKETAEQIKPFAEAQVELLLKIPDQKTFSGLRDYAIMVLMLDTGARISEVLGITRQGIDLGTRQIEVLRKGNKVETLPIGEACAQALKEYLFHVRDLAEGSPVFVSVYNNPMDRHQVYKRLKEYGKRAKIRGVRVSPHTFRHTFAKMYLMNGGDMESLRKMMGHATLAMVKKYLNLLSKDVQTQHRKYSPADSIIRKRRH